MIKQLFCASDSMETKFLTFSMDLIYIMIIIADNAWMTLYQFISSLPSFLNTFQWQLQHLHQWLLQDQADVQQMI